MPSAPHTPRRFRLAWTLAVAYLLTVVYASGQPFRGWRIPPPDVIHFLTAPWPCYVTLDDVLLNIVAYVPVGFLLALALRPHVRTHRAAVLAMASGILLSNAMEYMQTLLPGRVSSNIDVLTNAIGTMLGALAAPMFGPTRQLGERLFRLRDRWFAPGIFADAGLVLIALWLVTAMHPVAQLFGTGDVRTTLDLPVWVLHRPEISVAAEAAIVCLNMLGIALLLATLLRPGVRLARLAIGASLAALLIKAAATAGVKTASHWSWLTPGVTLGLLLGAALLYAAAQLRGQAAAWCGALVIALAVAVINVAPGNPYQTVPPQFLAGGASHFLSYTGIVRTVSELWPLLAILYLLAAALGAGARRKHSPEGATYRL
jgi:VanZ family protein